MSIKSISRRKGHGTTRKRRAWRMNITSNLRRKGHGGTRNVLAWRMRKRASIPSCGNWKPSIRVYPIVTTRQQKKFQNDILSRDNEIKRSEENNQSLRRYIDSTRNAQEPLRGENKYVQDFEDLNNKITLWIGAQSKKNANATLQINTRTAILTKTKSFGNYGVHTATQIEHSLKELYVSKKTRAPLVRHILSLFLFDRIFYPFAFALKNPDPSHEASNYLKYLEDDLFTQGLTLA